MAREGLLGSPAREQIVAIAKREPERSRVVGGRMAVTHRRLAEIIEVEYDRLAHCFELWRRFKLYGLPYAGGWAQQPAIMIDVLDVLLSEEAAAEDHERRQRAARQG